MASRQSAIREKCNDCAAGDSTLIRCCQVLDCSLWHFRMGYRSNRNEIYYNSDLYRTNINESQVEFNRILKNLKKQADESV